MKKWQSSAKPWLDSSMLTQSAGASDGAHNAPHKQTSTIPLATSPSGKQPIKTHSLQLEVSKSLASSLQHHFITHLSPDCPSAVSQRSLSSGRPLRVRAGGLMETLRLGGVELRLRRRGRGEGDRRRLMGDGDRTDLLTGDGDLPDLLLTGDRDGLPGETDTLRRGGDRDLRLRGGDKDLRLRGGDKDLRESSSYLGADCIMTESPE